MNPSPNVIKARIAFCVQEKPYVLLRLLGILSKLWENDTHLIEYLQHNCHNLIVPSFIGYTLEVLDSIGKHMNESYYVVKANVALMSGHKSMIDDNIPIHKTYINIEPFSNTYNHNNYRSEILRRAGLQNISAVSARRCCRINPRCIITYGNTERITNLHKSYNSIKTIKRKQIYHMSLLCRGLNQPGSLVKALMPLYMQRTFNIDRNNVSGVFNIFDIAHSSFCETINMSVKELSGHILLRDIEINGENSLMALLIQGIDRSDKLVAKFISQIRDADWNRDAIEQLERCNNSEWMCCKKELLEYGIDDKIYESMTM